METATTTPFDRMGGEVTVRMLVDHFYRIMDESPQARPLRAMHAADLAPMREALDQTPVPADVRALVEPALARVADALRNR